MTGGLLANVPYGVILVDSFNASLRPSWCKLNFQTFPKREACDQPNPVNHIQLSAGQFIESPIPRGLPVGMKPIFMNSQVIDNADGNKLYLVEIDGRKMVGKLKMLQNSIVYMPRNNQDGLRPRLNLILNKDIHIKGYLVT